MQRTTLAACALAALALPTAAPHAAPSEPSRAAVEPDEASAEARNRSTPRARNSDMSSPQEQIRTLIETRYPGFVRAGDAEGYAGQFTDDALWMPPGETDRIGPRQIAETLGAELEAVDLHPVITVREVSIVGDHAWVVGEDDITVVPRDGGAEARVVYTVLWLLRRVDGEWKIARQIWNQKPAAEGESG